MSRVGIFPQRDTFLTQAQHGYTVITLAKPPYVHMIRKEKSELFKVINIKRPVTTAANWSLQGCRERNRPA